MSRPAPRAMLRLALAAAALVASVAVGRAFALMRAAPVEPPPAPSVATFDYDAAMARFGGRLSGGATRELEGLDLGRGDTALVVVITQQDLVTCEDLGRQIRALRRAWGHERPIAVWGDSAHVAELESFLRAERIPRARVGPIPASAVLSDGAALWTPAAILATRDGRIVEGVSHTLKSPNVRLQSFAEELVTLRRRSP